MAKDFSEDGAFGAVGGTGAPAATTSAPTQSFENNDSGGMLLSTGGTSRLPQGYDYYAGGALNGMWNSWDKGPTLGVHGGPNSQAARYMAGSPNMDTIMFEDGGGVPDDAGDGMNGFQSRVNVALATVDNALSYGRRLHGLQTPDAAGEQKLAGNIPAAPASQSESGAPPQRPFPRLDPAPNPFGKRRMSDAGDQEAPQRMAQKDSDGDFDSDTGAIPEEEETA